MNNTLVFDIETVPDVAAGREWLDAPELSDADVADALYHQRRQEQGHEFLRLHWHRVVAISTVFSQGDQIAVWSLGAADASEAELLERFFHLIERYQPTLVSWNGGGFDLPVLHYRSLLHGVVSPRYWDQGQDDRNFRYNNYLSRYHERHTDVMDLLALYNARANAPLDQIAVMLGFPGKMGMSGAKVWDAYQAGDIEGIRNYCETDVLNTWLVYLRFQLIRGHISRERHTDALAQLTTYLEKENKPHFQEFLQRWQNRQPQHENAVMGGD